MKETDESQGEREREKVRHANAFLIYFLGLNCSSRLLIL